MNAILLAVVLALLSFVQLAARPKVELLGAIEGNSGFHSLTRHPEAAAPEGLMLFRFNGAIIFFSAAHFKREVLKAVGAAGNVRWFVLDLVPVNMIDATGVFTIKELFEELRARGITTCAVGRETEWTDWAAARGLEERLAMTRFFPTLDHAASSFEAEVGTARSSPASAAD
jgi:MFS superfamily sulfate permease-like transporter